MQESQSSKSSSTEKFLNKIKSDILIKKNQKQESKELHTKRYVSNKIFGDTINNNDGNRNEEPEEESIESLLAQIEDIKQTSEQNETPQLSFNNSEEKGCFHKTGVVTLVTDNYVLIENDYMCEMKYVVPQDLKKGDKVYYMAYRANENGDLKIRKIEYKFDAVWEQDEIEPLKYSEPMPNIELELDKPVESFDIDPPKPHIENQPVTKSSRINKYCVLTGGSSDKIVKKRDINKRTYTDKVVRRNGREVFFENYTDISVNLDNISSEFVPMIGDWVKIECLVEVNEEIPNFQGEILQVESILPNRSFNKLGKITHYDNQTEVGRIEETIIFTKAVCSDGYIPCVGDKVVAQSIESDQGLQQRWRAMKVVPLEDVSNRFETETVKFKPQLPDDEKEELLKDKENIEITNNLTLTLNAKEEEEIDIVIKNNGNVRQTLFKCAFLSRRSNSQLQLVSPKENEQQFVVPGSALTYKFKCRAKIVGVSEEMVIFKFRKFKIARIVQITVNSINPKKDNSNEGSTNTYNRHCNQYSIIPRVYEEGMYIRGVKPYKVAKFIPVRPVTWKIPDVLWTVINKIKIEQKTHSEAVFALVEAVPCLHEPLSIRNYKKRFDYLLYLEEIEQTINMQKFDMKSATLHRSGEYLTLNVPGLAENRPSLILGDRVIVSFLWDSTGGEKKYEGYIHKIRSSDVFLQFHQSFHESYHGEDCQISFKGSTTVIQRCHTAISTVVNRLGQDFLFPKKVKQQEPQYNFVEEEEASDGDNKDDSDQLTTDPPMLDDLTSHEEKVKILEDLLSRRKLKWFNKRLNKYQKEAVKNVLKGLARPLPYVIFGPPGTGKTITVCEAILQILFTMSESRILIATPSNSSANLIAERLLDSNLLKPGDLIRLVAHHYLQSESIPEKLIPYCVTADIASEGSRGDVNHIDPRGCKTNVTLSVLCQHRMIIGTCSALGILYNMGCKSDHFTHVIIDEAGQACEPEIMIPLSLAHSSTTQVILAGDPKQLGPVNQSRLAGYYGLNDSFLVRLLQQFPYQRDPEGFEFGYDPRLVTKLLINYRSLPDLLDLPNKLFYEAELIPQVDPENSDEAKLLESLADMLPKRLGTPPAIIFHNVDGTNVQEPDSPSWHNPEEATQIYIYLLELYNRGLEPDDIGIITPYSKQVYNVRNLLAAFEMDIPKVGSVEEFQGQERKVIILSTVRTAPDKVREDITHALGFVSARERLNVAITRARSLLIIIGNAKLLYQDVYWRSVLDHCLNKNSCVNLTLEKQKTK
ncbi:hypothetical protein TSAR_010596 [Trichomalopsis sarcophagae]|uniref:RNA helicase n=1 Tax=Trichomalopsis sarcophagae TaxID=543379 RepID=A0A232F138_9HYME|nr:hypothetical protein TSAR_010596 [Trichomalopsis sarcophagae]